MKTPNPPSHSFQHKLKVQDSDIDEMGHVNNVVYLRWVQEVAQAHWQSAPSHLQEQYAWVVLRHEIDYRQPALPEEEVVGYTWIGTHSGPRIERYVSLYKAATNELLAEAKTSWCLLDAEKHRPRRIDEELLQAFS
ncbi:acyl-CoA thioesterase [Nafulsella turpanensis]|uniref:acyl-CoA thioesterase n=1 Tax=Nafulsella turpanensis TaxID=1265690 RepID=UPI00034C110E|nr:thioesterase family protein [Nafulsella turpanensis]